MVFTVFRHYIMKADKMQVRPGGYKGFFDLLRPEMLPLLYVFCIFLLWPYGRSIGKP